MADKGRTLLIVEDDPALQKQMRWSFDDYEVVLASDRESALAQIRRHEPAVIKQIAAAAPDVLLVAMGIPLQDVWIRRHAARLNAKVAMGVGGLFDFYSGRIPRAPSVVRTLRLEWAFRMVQEPTRLWQRYLLGNPLFLMRLGQETVRTRTLHDWGG